MRDASRTGAGRRPGGAALWAPVVLYAGAIFLASSIERPPAPPGNIPDYVMHAVLYAGFAVVILRALAGGRWSGVTLARAGWTIAAAVAYGLTDELHQWFVPGRFVELSDLAADAIGAAIGAGAVLLARRSLAGPAPSRSSS